MEKFTYIIVGGGLAGHKAVQGIRKIDPSSSLVLICAEDHIPYQRPPLSKSYLTGNKGLDQVYLKNEDFYQKQNIKLIRGLAANRIEPEKRMVCLADGSDLYYEKLLLATGSTALRLPLPGNELNNVFTLRTIEDSDSIRKAAESGAEAVVIGGSFIGSETAASLVKMGVKVTMIFPEIRILARLVPEQLSRAMDNKFREQGVKIITGTKPVSFAGQGKVSSVELDSGKSIPADLVIMGVGVKLNTALALEAGLDMGERGSVLTDVFLRTRDKNIYAAGDIVCWPDQRYGKRLRLEHWDAARAQGLRAGKNMAGEEKPYKTLPYFFSDIFDFSLEAWGDLGQWDKILIKGDIDKRNFVIYYFFQDRLCAALSCGKDEAEKQEIEEKVKACVF